MNQKKQHILVLIQDQENTNIAIEHSFTLARIFSAKLAVAFYPSKKNQNLASIEKLIHEKSKQFSISYRFFEFGNLKKEPNNSIQQLDAILIVTQFSPKSLNNLKRHSIYNWILNAKIPTIALTAHSNINCSYENIIVPIDHRKESKEKMIWASYFGRFNKAIVHLITPKEKSASYIRTIKATLIFTKKMFEAFTFQYQIIKTNSKSKNINLEAIEISKDLKSDLLILMSNRNPGWIASHYGPGQLKKILREEKNPVLFINPLKDYYLPCS